MKKIGVFVCHCGINIASTVDVDRVVEEIRHYPGVAYAENYQYMCSDPGQKIVQEAIEREKLDGVIVAACSPTLHELTFRRTSEAVGLNPYQCEMANIREQCSWVHQDREEATAKAIKIIKSLVEKVRLDESLEPISVPVTRRALVIGAGIAGIQSALDIANSGHEVILVERSSSIGGHMAQLSETFPTLDCSQCILTPKMVEVGQHPKIKLMAYSEVEEIAGYVGNFTAKIRQKARFVDWERCNGCAECALACPVDVPNPFDRGLSTRKAIYRPFPQAVPNKFVIEKAGVPPCRATCPAGVNAQGYVALIAAGKYDEALALEREANPFASVCGRVCSHPCETECKRGELDQPLAIRHLKRFIAKRGKASGKSPARPEEGKRKASQKKGKVAIVGAGPAGLTAARDLASWGYSVTVFEAEKVLGGMLTLGIPAFRLSREALQDDIDYIKEFAVQIKTNAALGRDFTIPQLFKRGFQAVFLATGAYGERKLGVPGEEAHGVFYALDLLKKINTGRSVKVKGRVVVIGGGNSAVDAARSLVRLGAQEVTILYRRSRQEMPAYAEEVVEAEEEGVKLHFLAAPVEILTKAERVVGLKCQKMKLGAPDESGRRRPVPVEGSEFQVEADVVVAAIGEQVDLSFVSKKDSLETTSWGRLVADPVTLETSMPGVFAGGDVVSGPATVIEAIAAGRRAAVSIDRFIKGVDLRQGREVQPQVISEVPGLVDRPKRDRVAESKVPAPKRVKGFGEVTLSYSEQEAVQEALRCLNCGICCECRQCELVCEPEAMVYYQEDQIVEEEVGAVVVATGYDTLPVTDLGEYGYGKYSNVIDGLAFERLLSASGPTEGEIRRPSDGKVPKEVVFVQCAGSRDPEKYCAHCSKICCMYTAKHALLYKHRVHDGQPYIFYIDVRTAGKSYEEFYHRVSEEEGVPYIRGKVSKVFQDGDKLIVWGVDTLTGKKIEIVADMVVLATAMVPSQESQKLFGALKMVTDENGFLSEAHPKLRPVESIMAGFFLAGAAQGPRDIPETVAQASGAASKVIGLFSQKELHHEPIVAVVDEDLCSSCKVCISVCPYDAREFDEEENIVKVNELLCEGCGACVVSCPSGATQQKNLTDDQIRQMVQAVLGE